MNRPDLPAHAVETKVNRFRRENNEPALRASDGSCRPGNRGFADLRFRNPDHRYDGRPHSIQTAEVHRTVCASQEFIRRPGGSFQFVNLGLAQVQNVALNDELRNRFH